ncbi:heavy metal-binding domain-containing protein [Tellurirhabdus bombi]|uniref:heavy metal-binding domain-containing protein n=1 Tax=Tellurirhabdus bombi TaxID=2907205 RepID=UPI001F35D221|nr:heavy metal-binding domain-containing protein [Tellurirhabdus bombi]
MTTELTACPNCDAKLKGGMFSNASLLPEHQIRIINEYRSQKSAGYCTKCGPDLYSSSVGQIRTERSQMWDKIKDLLSAVPVLSIQSPLNWDYTVVGMVTGQSTTGTGAISDFTSSITDMFGLQSGRYNAKIKSGERICFAQLRKQALEYGGNAVVGTDIDYSEVGGEKGMLLVCAAGTAVKLNNLDALDPERKAKLEELMNVVARWKALDRYNTSEN